MKNKERFTCKECRYFGWMEVEFCDWWLEKREGKEDEEFKDPRVQT